MADEIQGLHGNIYNDHKPKAPQMLEWLNGFECLLKECCKFWELDFDSFEYITPLVVRAFIRIGQRAHYYLYFHSKPTYTTKMAQSKRVALLAFWVLKYKPIITSTENATRLYIQTKAGINEFFATYIIFAYVAEKSKRSDIESYFDEKVLENLVYNLSERDLSKESLILYINSLLNISEDCDV